MNLTIRLRSAPRVRLRYVPGLKGDQGEPGVITHVNGKTGSSITLTPADIGAEAENATLSAIASLVLAANKLIYGNGANSAALTDLSAFGRSLIDDADAGAARTTLGAQAALGFTPVQQGGGTSQSADKVYLGKDTGALFPRIQVGTSDLGRVWTDSQAGRSLGGSGYQIFPGGLIVQYGMAILTPNVGGFASIVFPISFTTTNWAGAALNGDSNANPTMIISKNRSSLVASRYDLRFIDPSGAPVTSAVRVEYLAAGF